jgi:hypothetical protein
LPKKQKHLKGIKKLDLNGRTLSFLKLSERLKNLDHRRREEVFDDAAYHNPWFTRDNIELAFAGLLNYLDKRTIDRWLKNYRFNEKKSLKVGVVMAGNIPMVGIHDMICVLLSGHHLMAKLSSQDQVLIKFISDELIDIAPEWKNKITFADRLKEIDAVIATGSDNTARYFDYYFAKIPHIIRKNRTSIAIINGTESKEELQNLGKDIFSYFGLGCRNVSKIFIPLGYDPTSLFPYWDSYIHIADHHKYHNNYHYQRTIMLVNQTPHSDNGFVMLQQNENLVSPIGVLYYEFYDQLNDLKGRLHLLEDKIQCIVTNENFPGKIKFGKAQMPDINDFADNIDTMEFLSNL